MARPRILILTTAYLPLIGGSELAIANIIERLPQYDFDLVTGRHTPDQPLMEEMGSVRVFRAGGRLSRLTLTHPKFLLPFAMAITAWRLARTHDYVVMHAYQASQAAGAGLLVHWVRPSLPFLVTLQEGKELDKQAWPVRWARALILRSADRVTAISTYLAQYVRRYTNAVIDIIPNGVDVQGLAHPGVKVFGVPPTIVSISRLVPKNGIENLVRAFALVTRDMDARLVLVGSGDLLVHLRALATDLQIAGRVDFIGGVPHAQLTKYLHRADIFVRPSLSEGLGSAFLEAMAADVPVVASRVGGIADFLEHEQTGLVCDPTSPADIARQIERFITDAPLRERVVAQARAMVHQRYDWDVVARQMGQVYQAIAQA